MTVTSLLSKNTESSTIEQKTKSISKSGITELPKDMSSGRFIIIEEKDLEKRIDARVDKKIKKIFQERGGVDFRKISNAEAKKEITNFILHMKKMGVLKISILDIVNKLKLPPEQIERVIKRFEKAGRISEINK